MTTVLGELLPLAVAIAVSPISLIAVILLLLSPGIGRTRLTFVLGWVLGIAVTTAVFTVLAAAFGLDADEDPSSSTSWVRTALGAALVWLAVKQWRSRPRAGGEVALPAWLRALDHLTPGRAGALGIGLTLVNPKNLVLCAAAGAAIGGSGVQGGDQVLAVALFTLVAAAAVVGIVVAHALAGSRLDPRLADLRHWLEANNAAVMGAVLLVMGAVLIGKGLGSS